MELFFRTYGQGQPIIILHGLFGFSDNWQTIAKALANEYSVITVDQRNHGKSPHLPTHTYTDLSEDLYHFLNTQWIFESVIIGHSMGGKAAMQFALDYPDMVKKLVVIDIAPGQSKNRQDDVINALLDINLEQQKDRKEIEIFLMERLNDAGTVQFLLKNLTRDDTGQLQWKMNIGVLAQAQDHILAAVSGTPYSGPALFVRGSKSGYITDTDQPSISSLFPNAEVVTIENAGHWVHADQPQILIDLLKEFLERS
jgi:esterase